MPFIQQMKGLRRNEDAMKTVAGIPSFIFIQLLEIIIWPGFSA